MRIKVYVNILQRQMAVLAKPNPCFVFPRSRPRRIIQRTVNVFSRKLGLAEPYAVQMIGSDSDFVIANTPLVSFLAMEVKIPSKIGPLVKKKKI